MEFLYNPDSMSEEEIKETFVARQWMIDELVSMTERQPDGAGVQHILIIAPRGMGKTTVLLMVKFAIKDRGFANRWQAVKFPEESYGVYDLSDFWLETLNLIASDTSDEELQKRAENLKAEYPNNDDLQEAALAMIKDWRRKHKKRLVLLVDNLDMILEQINDERDNARLRELLMNDGTMMMIGCAVSHFREVREYDQPLYNFFKIYDLANLKFEQMQELLRRRAALDGRENFEEKLKENAGRLRVLEYFTGGNPRLVLMLYRVVTQSNISEVRRALEKLLDEVTPYFKSKVESLPAQQRKILDQIARVSSRTNEGLTPTEIAGAVRLTSNQVSAQLKRLSDDGYVRAANLRGRSSYYTLSEPLYAIWHQMRFGRDARERMQWLVNFLKVWYDAKEVGPESTRLESRFREFLGAGRMREARDALDHRFYLAEAMDDSPVRASTIDGVVRGYLELKDKETLKDVLNPATLASLPDETLKLLYEAGCISEKVLHLPKAVTSASNEARQEAEFLAAIAQGVSSGKSGRTNEALEYFDQAIKIKLDDALAWNNRGVALGKLGRHEEAIADYSRAIEINPNDTDAWSNRGSTFIDMGKYEEAIADNDRAIEIDPAYALAWNNRGVALSELGRYEESIADCDRAIEIDPDYDKAWYNRGNAYSDLGRDEEAIASYDRAIKINPDDADAWYNRALIYLKLFVVLIQQNDSESAKQNWDKALTSASHLKKEEWQELASWSLITTAQAGHLEFVRQIISESELEEPLFPLARAIDYVLTGDEALIEKLSPEVRGIVEEIVITLQKTVGKSNQQKTKSGTAKSIASKKSAPGKSKPGLRRPTKRQLK